MKQSDNEFGNSHKEQEISGQLPQKPSSCSKGITYKAKDFEEINSLLSDPVLRAAMPKNIRNDKKAPREPKKHFNQKNEGIC